MEAVLGMYTTIGDLGVQPSQDLISLISFDEHMAFSQLETGLDQLGVHLQNSGTIASFSRNVTESVVLLFLRDIQLTFSVASTATSTNSPLCEYS